LSKPYDQVIVLDFETAWGRSPDVRLGFSTQTNEEYVRDPRFKAWGLSWKPLGRDEGAVWVTREDLPKFFAAIDWSRTAVVAQNALFDVSIMAWHYNARPAFIFDTLSMGRALYGVEVGNSLKKLAERFGLPPKGDGLTPSENILDKLPAAVEEVLADYCCHDTWLCEQIFLRMIEGYPTKELRLIDMTLRMYTNACLELDREMLIKALSEEGEKREGLLKKLGIEEAALASNPKFAEVLTVMGVTPPTKVSKTTGKEAFAFAKNDALFQALLNGGREDVALLCEARLRVKSTTERTRAQRFLDISGRGPLPVPLSYYGAATGRWTAAKGSAINMQNLKRGSFLRKAIMAPVGHQLVVGDLSQIEPRVLAWLADYEDMLDIFRSGSDAYAAFGAQMFNIPGLSKESHPDLRQSAKSALLGCGYGLGWASFAAQLLVGFLGAPPVRYDKAFAKKLGVDGAYAQRFMDWEDNPKRMFEIPHTCTDEELLIHCLAAKKIIDIYRSTAHPVVSFWDMCSKLMEKSLYGGEEVVYKCVTFRKEEIVLPSGMTLKYPNLRNEYDKETKQRNWVYGEAGVKPTKLYAGKITNNIVQGTARVVMTDGMLRVDKKYPVVGTVHDELLCVVPDDEVEYAKDWVLEQMIAAPKYMPGIPLNSEVGAHRRYGLAKG
jgi:DNA polymerase III epsilon subunit-like protein